MAGLISRRFAIAQTRSYSKLPRTTPSQRLIAFPGPRQCRRISPTRVQTRHISGAGEGKYTKIIRDMMTEQHRKSPTTFFLALAAAAILAFGVATSLVGFKQPVDDLSMYPRNVANNLRKAKAHGHPNSKIFDPGMAMREYQIALAFAKEAGMDELSDEVLGIWISMSEFLESLSTMEGAISILETRRQEVIKWIDENGEKPGMAAERTRLLKKAIQFGHKIGELYSSRYDPDKEKSERYLVWAVETTLNESHRRREEGVKPGEGEFLDADQQGAQLEKMAHHYEEKDNFYYAAQLFLQALIIKPKRDCHDVILMNNLAAALAQQIPLPEPGHPPPSRAQLRDSGRTWLKQALDLSSKIKPPVRNEECDRGCAVAIHNLGEFAEMDGNVAEARAKYEEAVSIAHAISFEEGVISSREGLKRTSKDSG